MNENILKSNKITGLEKLAGLGFNVPKFAFIPDFSDLGLSLIDLNHYYPPSKLESIIKEQLKSFDYKKTGISIRSASFDEDDSVESAAGRYLSYNGITSSKEVPQACIDIWKHHRANSKGVKCPLIIQETHPSFFSGVCCRDNDTLIIESYYGACRNIVEGLVRPYITIIKENKTEHNYLEKNNYNYNFIAHTNLFKDKFFHTGKLLIPKINTFPDKIRVYSKINNKTLYVYGCRPPFPVQRYEEIILPKLIEITHKLNNEKGVDIEWGSDENGNVFLYQFRTLTRKIDDLNIINNENYVCGDTEFIGIPTSKGIAEGIISYNINNINENTILFLKQDYIEDLSILKKVKGIISINGGILSHLSIMCRESRIPCIVSINQTIADGSAIVMDCNSGIIKLI